MGREAICACMWGNARYQVKALLEPPELIVRGEMKRRVPFEKIRQVRADGSWLYFALDGESVALELGDGIAAKWAEALLKPPPSLAKKLGITPETTVRMIGPIDDSALRSSLAEAKSISPAKGHLILARVDTPDELKNALKRSSEQLRAGIPIWLIYRKGSGHPLNENLVRTTALAAGIVDTKVAAVSAEFSALRFVKRRD